MSIWDRHRTWYTAKYCRVHLDTGPLWVKNRQSSYEWGKTKPIHTATSNRRTISTVDGTQVWRNGGMITGWGKPNYCEKKNLPHCHSAHHKSHTDYPTVKSAIRTWRPTAWGNWQCCYLEFKLWWGQITRVTKTGADLQRNKRYQPLGD